MASSVSKKDMIIHGSKNIMENFEWSKVSLWCQDQLIAFHYPVLRQLLYKVTLWIKLGCWNLFSPKHPFEPVFIPIFPWPPHLNHMSTTFSQCLSIFHLNQWCSFGHGNAMIWVSAIDWLVDRRHCNLKWQSLVLTIREKINAAIQDMPESQEIAQLLSGSCECFGAALLDPRLSWGGIYLLSCSPFFSRRTDL